MKTTTTAEWQHPAVKYASTLVYLVNGRIVDAYGIYYRLEPDEDTLKFRLVDVTEAWEENIRYTADEFDLWYDGVVQARAKAWRGK